jgi:hypothetical protein
MKSGHEILVSSPVHIVGQAGTVSSPTVVGHLVRPLRQCCKALVLVK